MAEHGRGAPAAGGDDRPAHVGRRTVIVEGFQRRFIVTQMAWLAVLLAVLSILVFASPVATILGPDEARSQAMAERFLTLHESIWPLTIAFFISATFITVLLTHRVAGPLHRFRRVFDDVGHGRLNQRVRLRTTDYLKEEAMELDGMVVALRSRVERVKALQASVRGALDLLQTSSRPITVTDLQVLRDAINRTDTALEGFKTDMPSGQQASVASDETRARRSMPPPRPQGVPHGFSLIELLMVMTIIGIIASVAIPSYMHALTLARNSKAIGDLKGIERVATEHNVRVGCLPSTLLEMGLDHLTDPWGRSYVYAPIAPAAGGGGGGRGGGGGGGGSSCTACNGGCISQNAARKDKNLHPVNSDFDVYSRGPDGLTASALTAGTARDDVIRGANGGFFGLGADF